MSDALLVTVILPSYLTISPKDKEAFKAKLLLPEGSKLMEVAGLPMGAAHNFAAQQALRSDLHLALWHPVLYIPPDGFMLLEKTKRPLICGAYRRLRKWTFGNLSEDEHRIPIADFKKGDIISATLIPDGFTLYRHELLRKVFAKYTTPFVWAVDTGIIIAEGEKLPKMGSDYIFSWRSERMGFPGSVHTGIKASRTKTKGLVGISVQWRKDRGD